jgi:hypothetical protein
VRVQSRERAHETIMHEIVLILLVSYQCTFVTAWGRYVPLNLGDFARR